MKADLARREPAAARALGDERPLGTDPRRRPAGPRFVLHDGPPYANGNIHIGHALNKILKDLVVAVAPMAGFDAPYVPGWDCHGLPIELKVDRELGAKKREMSIVEFCRACRAYAERFVGIQREQFQRLGVLGDWDRPVPDDGLPVPGGDRARASASSSSRGSSTRARSRSTGAPLPHRARRGGGRVRGAHAPVDLRRVPAGRTAARREARRRRLRRRRLVLIWTTTPWTIPSNLAIAFHPDVDYAVIESDGRALHRRRGARGSRGEGRRLDGRTVSATLAGKRARGAPVPPPAVRRVARRADADEAAASFRSSSATTSRSTPAPALVHTAPGHGADDFDRAARRPRDLRAGRTGGRFTTESSCSAGKRVFDANPEIVEDAEGARARSSRLDPKFAHQYPHCWRCQNPVIFRATVQWFIALDRPSTRTCAGSALDGDRASREVDPAVGRATASTAWSRTAPTGASRASASGACRSRAVPTARRRARGHVSVERRAAEQTKSSTASRALRRRRRRRLVRAARRRSSSPPALTCPAAAARASRRDGHPRRLVRLRRRATRRCCLGDWPELSRRGRPTCTSRAATSTAAGSSPRCSSRRARGDAPFTASSRTASSSTGRAGRCRSRSATSSRRRTSSRRAAPTSCACGSSRRLPRGRSDLARRSSRAASRPTARSATRCATCSRTCTTSTRRRDAVAGRPRSSRSTRYILAAARELAQARPRRRTRRYEFHVDLPQRVNTSATSTCPRSTSTSSRTGSTPRARDVARAALGADGAVPDRATALDAPAAPILAVHRRRDLGGPARRARNRCTWRVSPPLDDLGGRRLPLAAWERADSTLREEAAEILEEARRDK